MTRRISVEETLPRDADRALLVGRAWLPGPHGGPVTVVVRGAELFDITATAPTIAGLLALPDCAERVRQATGPSLGPLQDWLDALRPDRRGSDPLP